MKRFLIKLSAFLGVIVPIFFLISLLANGYTDPFYLRFTSPKQTSLILGTSRAAQGIQPAILNTTLQVYYPDLNIYNFSFTVAHSPFGPAYYNAIKEKLSAHSKGGLFIIAVDPWAISTRSNQPNDSTKFLENTLSLSTTHLFDIKPNPEYLLESYNKPLITLVYNALTNNKEAMLLHDDGWLEVSVPMGSNIVTSRTLDKIRDYKKNMLPRYKLSSLRVLYLEKTIKLLRKKGDVYLVRLPVDNGILNLEDKLVPNFNSIMDKIAIENDIEYFNLMELNHNYKYVDGNHLYKSSGKQVTREICKSIITLKSSAFKD